MGKKIEIKKIESKKRCQVTYTKRKNSLIKKAQEISISCGIDIALITFSPFKCGCLTKYCNRKRIEDVIQRYLDLSPEKRFYEVTNFKRHLNCTCRTKEMLKQLDHINNGDESKMHYLKKEIKDMEVKVTKAIHDNEILNKKLRVYEPDSAEDILPAQLAWLERKLKTTLEKVQNRKKELVGTPSKKSKRSSFQKKKMKSERKGGSQFSYNSRGSTNHQLSQEKQNPSSILLPMQNGPWFTPHRSFGFPKGSFQELLAQVSGASFGNYTPNIPFPEAASFPSNVYSSSAPNVTQTPPIQFNSEIQHLAMNPMMENQHTPLGIPNQQSNSHDQFNFSSVRFELPALGIQKFPITETSMLNRNNFTNECLILPPTSHNNGNNNSIASTGRAYELSDLTDIELESIVAADNNFKNNNNVVFCNSSNNDNNGNGNNGGCDELFDLTDNDSKRTILPVAGGGDNKSSGNDNNGGCDAAPSQENPLPNSDEAEKGDGIATSNIEGSKDDIGLWEIESLKWAENLSLEDLRRLLQEL